MHILNIRMEILIVCLTYLFLVSANAAVHLDRKPEKNRKSPKIETNST